MILNPNKHIVQTGLQVWPELWFSADWFARLFKNLGSVWTGLVFGQESWFSVDWFACLAKNLGSMWMGLHVKSRILVQCGTCKIQPW